MAEIFELTPQLFAEPERQPSFAEFEAVDELLVDAFELTLSIFDKRRAMVETDPDLQRMESQLGSFFLELLEKGVLLHLPPEERRHLHANLTDDLRNRLQLIDPAGTGYGPDDIQIRRVS
ncbi:MAG TPA: hypothetical protein VG992_03965 [Candidatus Saccharimonadales bacterium]|nr:hypothetical protein [Candidatus Saccharimonadales bacterium]